MVPRVTSGPLSILLRGLRAETRLLLEEIDAVDYHRRLEPSGWTVMQLVVHLARDDERYWWTLATADRVGRSRLPRSTGSPGPDVPDAPTTKVDALREYREAVAAAESVLVGRTPDSPTAWRDPAVPAALQLHTVGDVLAAAVLEYSIHLGHLEAAADLFAAGRRATPVSRRATRTGRSPCRRTGARPRWTDV